MPGKSNKDHAAITPPHLPRSAPVTALPEGALADHGIYSELVLAQCELSGQDAQEVTFEEVLFDHVRLNGTRLRASHLRDVRLDTCDLAEADWEKAQLTRVEIVDSRLLGFKACEARVQDTVIRGCTGRFALFWSATFKRVRFESCMLSDASFADADLSGVIFDRCDLRQADMQGAKLAGADFRGSQVEGLRVESSDLRGVIIDPTQAVTFASLLGLVVRWDE